MFDAKCCDGERESALEIRQVLRSAEFAGGQVCNRTHSLVAFAKATPALGGTHCVILYLAVGVGHLLAKVSELSACWRNFSEFGVFLIPQSSGLFTPMPGLLSTCV